MITSLLNDCLTIKSEPPDKLREYLKAANLLIFEPIFDNNKPEEAKQTILYILCSFSEDSPLLILRRDSDSEKEAICDYLDIPDYVRGKLFILSDQVTRKAATQYITEFASPLFKALKLIEIQLEDLSLAITNREYLITKEDKEETITLYDFKEHVKAVSQYELLLKRKDSLEKELKNQMPAKGIADLKEFKFQREQNKPKTGREGLAMENSKLIKLGNG